MGFPHLGYPLSASWSWDFRIVVTILLGRVIGQFSSWLGAYYSVNLPCGAGLFPIPYVYAFYYTILLY